MNLPRWLKPAWREAFESCVVNDMVRQLRQMGGNMVRRQKTEVVRRSIIASCVLGVLVPP
jgi:hypothetical protein